MADVISMNGVGGCAYVTMHLKAGGTYAVGNAVALTGNNEVGFATTSGDDLFGIINAIDDDGLATIQVSGFAENVTAASAVTVGAKAGVDKAGKIVAATAGRTAVVTAYDSASKLCTVML